MERGFSCLRLAVFHLTVYCVTGSHIWAGCSRSAEDSFRSQRIISNHMLCKRIYCM